MRPVLLAFALLLVTLGAAADAAELRLDARSGSGDAYSTSEFLRDPTGRLQLADVAREASAFRPVSTFVADLRTSALRPATLWFRLQPRAVGAGPWYLHAHPTLERADLYFVARDGHVERTPFGTLVPYAKRQLPTFTNLIALPERATREGSLYLRVVAREEVFGGFSIRPASWEATTGRESAEARLLPELAIVGLVGGLAAFNALLGFTLRERIYYWYAAATGCFALLEFMQTGAAWRWFWPHASVAFDAAVYAAYLAYLGLVVSFARVFLHLPVTQRRLWHAIVAIYGLGVLADTAFVVVPNVLDVNGISGVMDPLCSGGLLFAIFCSGLVAWRRGTPDARPYTIAFGGVLFGFVVGTLNNSHLFVPNDWTEAAPGLGVAWEAVFLALAMAERIRRLRGERDALEVAALGDALTGVANRRAFDRRLATEWRSDGSAQSLATILIDVDLFKSYNDAYGHLAGDRALKVVAAAIVRSVRADDFVARYGGEEFIVLLPFCDVAGAVAVADTIRATIASLAIVHTASPSGRLTISAGTASAVPGELARPEELIAAADRALYDAKRTGRNRVSVAGARVA